MYDCVNGMGSIIFSYGAIMANSCAVFTSSGPVALGLDPCFLVKILALTRMSLMYLVS